MISRQFVAVNQSSWTLPGSCEIRLGDRAAKKGLTTATKMNKR